MLLKIAYLLTCRVLSLAVLVFRSDLAKDAELLVLRHENAVLRRHAARGVNATERTIREITGMIRAKLTGIEQRLDCGLSLNELGELQRMPADLDRAITLRQHHWQVLGALLTETEIKSLQPAPAPDAGRSQSDDYRARCPAHDRPAPRPLRARPAR